MFTFSDLITINRNTWGKPVSNCKKSKLYSIYRQFDVNQLLMNGYCRKYFIKCIPHDLLWLCLAFFCQIPDQWDSHFIQNKIEGKLRALDIDSTICGYGLYDKTQYKPFDVFSFAFGTKVLQKNQTFSWEYRILCCSKSGFFIFGIIKELENHKIGAENIYDFLIYKKFTPSWFKHDAIVQMNLDLSQSRGRLKWKINDQRLNIRTVDNNQKYRMVVATKGFDVVELNPTKTISAIHEQYRVIKTSHQLHKYRFYYQH
eukprot:505580_1